jgi:SAM-dependent methyltransferase
VTAHLTSADGRTIPLAVSRWLDEASDGEVALLHDLAGPVLDVGCGPGRHLLALNRGGIAALGIDTAPEAVRLARRRGATAIVRSVFDALPGEGRWRTVLLMDGNVGIGGDPVALLRRVRALLGPQGSVLVEVEEGTALERLTVRLRNGGPAGPWFPWARVGELAIAALANEAGLRVLDRVEVEGRWFASLGR